MPETSISTPRLAASPVMLLGVLPTNCWENGRVLGADKLFVNYLTMTYAFLVVAL
ncbi:hypothetical protein QLH52_07490 [Methylomonas sp. OY6]|uniref:Uncharacterized protein n=1 Tax=Methylomonas defluvii TaxID=3045149 RepID=A0ABU4UCF2_9GAMM|nr:hypothetical protein [Methylomonas sp. OY6]